MASEDQTAEAADMVKVGQVICGPSIYVARSLIAEVGEQEVRRQVRRLLAQVQPAAHLGKNMPAGAGGERDHA